MYKTEIIKKIAQETRLSQRVVTDVLNASRRDIDFERNTIAVAQTVTVPDGKTPTIGMPKTKHSRRTFPVPTATMTALREHRVRQNEQRLALGADWHDHDLVFASETGTPVNPSNLRRDFLHWVETAGVPAIRIHDQRHTYATLAIEGGAPIGAISKQLGHARTSITMDVYAHVTPAMQQEVADRIEAVLFGP